MRYLIIALITLCLTTQAHANFEGVEMAPPPAEVVTQYLTDFDCEPLEDNAWSDYWDGTQVDINTRVHIVPCFMAVYNTMSKIIVEKRGDGADTSIFNLESFADYRTDLGWFASDMLTNAFINSETGHLAHFYKGRGLGDCGTTGSWEWTGYIFAMIEYRVEEDCDGRLPDEWPVVYARAPSQQAQETADCSIAPYCEDRRYFKDWLTACRAPRNDSSRYCSANAYVHNADAPAGFDFQLRIGRERRGEPLRVSLIAVFEMMNKAKPVMVRVDGETVVQLSPGEIETPTSINDYFIGPQDKTDQVIDAMRAGSEIEISYTAESGRRQTVPFSLSGITASLLWIQENAGL